MGQLEVGILCDWLGVCIWFYLVGTKLKTGTKKWEAINYYQLLAMFVGSTAIKK